MPIPRRGTVLIVDDQQFILTVLHRQLNAQGHTVVEASTAADALHQAKCLEGKLDLVISDVVMPGMQGTELAAILITRFPGLPVVLMSAYASAGLTGVRFGDTIIPILQKPFDDYQLPELIRSAVESSDRRRSQLVPVPSDG